MKILLDGALASIIISLASAVFTANAEIVPLPFGGAANSSFMDDLADDEKGGFIDLGSNDLRMLPKGDQLIGEIPFDIADSQSSADKACIVLGGDTREYLPQSGEIKFAKPMEGECLYLLHASAFTPADKKPIVGNLVLVYDNGRRDSRHVRIGRDVADWTSSRSRSNAFRAWTIYNNNTQVSLFVSKFVLQKGRKLSSVAFEAREGVWFVAAASLGDARKVREVTTDLKIKRSYETPGLFDKPLPVCKPGAKPRNVVIVIGDGMGAGTLALASAHLRGRLGALVMEQLPFAGLMTTYSANADVTDSAASATGFACGRKTNNSMLGMLPDKEELDSVAAHVHRSGFAVGLLTDDPLFGATPSAFYAHAPVRSANEKIALDASECGYEILLGYGCKEWFLPKKRRGCRKDGLDLVSSMSGKGYVLCETFKSFVNAPMEKRVLGCLKGREMQDDKCFKTMMDTALVRLSRDGKRFFMMMESADPDHGSHANKPEMAISGVVKAEWAVRSAVDWSLAHDCDTLVIAMSDHETGGVTTTVSPHTGKATVYYGATSHTGAPVPVHAFGPGAELFEGLFDATDVYMRLMSLLDMQ